MSHSQRSEDDECVCAWLCVIINLYLLRLLRYIYIVYLYIYDRTIKVQTVFEAGAVCQEELLHVGTTWVVLCLNKW